MVNSPEIFSIQRAKKAKIPILLSAPHCGINFPEEVRDQFIPEVISHPDDTDWFIHKLYDFAPEMGITFIHANYCRYLIDLNRDPKSQSLYNDGRTETALTPSFSFSGAPLYKNHGPSAQEIQRRLHAYYWPYYKKLEELLLELKTEFGKVLLFDAHSIRRHVSSISEKPFPDLILGNQDGKTASQELINSALAALLSSQLFVVKENFPFKGGMITRHFGLPETKVHALQLEMSQDIYMNEATCEYQPNKAESVRDILRTMFTELASTLKGMP